MKRALGIVVTCAGLVAAPAACGSDEGRTEGAASKPEQTAASNHPRAASDRERKGGRSGSSTTSVKVMNTRYGRMLFDGKGRALYLFTREQTSRARCYGDCAVAWPPFIARGTPTATNGAKGSLLGTTLRRNGKRQVTYRGHPLYYYVSDRKPGQVTCQNVEEFGGLWLVVSPGGRAIRAPR